MIEVKDSGSEIFPNDNADWILTFILISFKWLPKEFIVFFDIDKYGLFISGFKRENCKFSIFSFEVSLILFN